MLYSFKTVLLNLECGEEMEYSVKLKVGYSFPNIMITLVYEKVCIGKTRGTAT